MEVMKTEEKSKQEYIDAWMRYVEHLYVLTFTPNDELSQDVRYKLDELKELIKKVADDKHLKD